MFSPTFQTYIRSRWLIGCGNSYLKRTDRLVVTVLTVINYYSDLPSFGRRVPRIDRQL